MNTQTPRQTLLAAALILSLQAHGDFTPQWETKPCCASDIGVGANGAVWIVGHSLGGNGDVFRWNGTTWVKEEGLRGDAIAVDGQGLPWIVNHGGDIFRPSGGTWEKAPGRANDIAIGADGSVWITGYNRNFDGVLNGDLFKWDGNTWVKETGVQGVRLAVAPDGEPTIINTDGDIFKRENGAWFKVNNGQAGDVGIGANNSTWITGTRPDGLNHEIYRWNGVLFEKALGAEATRLSVAPNGEPWLVDADGDVFVGRLNINTPIKPIIDLGGFTVGPAGVTLTVATATGSTYHLEKKATLGALQWQDVDQKAGTGGNVTLADPGAPGASGFYQIRVTQP